MPRYLPVTSHAHFAQEEKELLTYWKERSVFEKSLELRKTSPRFVFYEGPPTANGKPGIHHVLARSYKDLFIRYKQMDGFYVPRKAGWDTHGLPVELEIEKKLKISGKKEIEEYGVAAFNELCKKSVSDYIDDWEAMTERLGFWLDMQNPYRTYDGTFIESVWWSLKELWDNDYLYQGYKVTPYCPRCQTTLSSHELSLGYRDDVEDPSVFIKFQSSDDPHVSMLAWTTTPWTLPGNVALAVHPDEEYVRIELNGEGLILARARLSVIEGEYTIVESMPGADLVGRSYVPLFDEMLPEGKAFVVLSAPDLVSMSDGTGIVHTAAAYGEADLALCQKNGIAIRHVVGLDGKFLDGISKYRGMFVKKADPLIIEELSSRGRLYRAERIRHTYPFCWRCESPLLYYALTSWFIRTTAVKEKLIANNATVSWQPSHIRDGRMGNWLETLVDWNISRSRYWGTPLPIWICDNADCAKKRCVGSASELGLTVADDLHKPYLDEIPLTCEACGGTMHRVPDVIDCWYDSGSMPFAQLHYPFENTEEFAKTHPADFISEAMDQTRGWFFSLLAVSTLLFGKPAYRNVVCLGLVLDEKGKKMSKSKGNIVDPWSIFNEYGADAMRWYFFSAVSAGSEYRVGPDAIVDVVRRFFLTLWNTYVFFITYAAIDDFDPSGTPVPEDQRPALDVWCRARLAATVNAVRESLDRYDATNACRTIEEFVEDLSKWYVRRSRRRFWKAEDVSDIDKRSAYETLWSALTTLADLMAPFTPFLSERLYRNLMGFLGDAGPVQGVPESVHLRDFPTAKPVQGAESILVEMARCRKLVEAGLAARKEANIKVRQPLREALVAGPPLPKDLEEIFADELNVKSVAYDSTRDPRDPVYLDTEITPDLQREWLVREVSRKVNELRKQAKLELDDRIELFIAGEGMIADAVREHESHLKQETLATIVHTTRVDDALATWEGAINGEECWLAVRR
ncbi:MAG: isoleucine--tRNA ligase [Candidatus Dormibacteria bacterium]